MNLVRLERRIKTPGCFRPEHLDGQSVRRFVRRHGPECPAAVAARHADRAINQIAEVVGQVGIVARLETLFVEVGVLTCRDVTHEVIAQSFRAVAVGQRIGIDHIARAFAHLGATEVPPAMNQELRHDLKARRLEHDRPVNSVRRNQNIFADDLHVAGPEFREIG